MPNAIRICTLSRARSPVTRFYFRNSRWVIIIRRTEVELELQTTMAQAVFAPSPCAPGARARIGTGHTRSKPRVPPRATADGDANKQRRRTEVKFEREVPAGDERERDVCVTCGFVDYRNPKVVVGSVPVWVSPSRLVPSMHPRVG